MNGLAQREREKEDMMKFCDEIAAKTATTTTTTTAITMTSNDKCVKYERFTNR